MKADIRILVVDDDRTLREGCASVLQLDGYSVTFSGRGDEALELVKRRKFDIILVDLYLTPISGLDILKAALEAHRDTIVVVMTGNPSVTSSIEALRLGAWDYLPKPFSATHLQVLIGRASHAVMVARETNDLRLQLASQNGNSDKLTLLGVSPAFRRAVELARKVASTDASVMITGESGTGKEVIAQFIHQHSRREDPGRVELWPLVTAEKIETDYASVEAPRGKLTPPHERLARLIAVHAKSLIGKERRARKGELLHPGHFMVLVRRRNEFVNALVRELKREQIQVAGVDRLNLGEELAIQDLLAMARFVNPNRPLAGRHFRPTLISVDCRAGKYQFQWGRWQCRLPRPRACGLPRWLRGFRPRGSGREPHR